MPRREVAVLLVVHNVCPNGLALVGGQILEPRHNIMLQCFNSANLVVTEVDALELKSSVSRPLYSEPTLAVTNLVASNTQEPSASGVCALAKSRGS